MPNVIMGAPSSGMDFEDSRIEVKDYRYPFNLDLRPESALHNKIVTRVMLKADEAYAKLSQRHADWNKTDNTLRAFIPLSEAEKALKKDSKGTKAISIVVPYSYATLETLLAYCTKAFLTDNVFQYEGSAPEDTVNAKLLELAVNQQVHRFKSILEMHTALRDSFSYGFGMSTLNWAQKWGKKPVLQESQDLSVFGSVISTRQSKTNVNALLFEGNEVINIDPYRALLDPNVSIHNVQNGEYVGWLEFKTMNRLLSDEATGGYFNVSYLKQQNGQPFSKYQADVSSRIVTKNINNTNPKVSNYVTVIPMYCTIIPKDWGLPGTLDGNSSGEYPEKWLFVIANDSIVIRCAPLGLNHNMYPVAISAPDYDGYSITPLARMELVSGLQTTLDWLFNSHITNVRKAINDMFVVDPSLINMEDMENPEPGKLVKLRRQAWGRGVDNAVKQFNVSDVTRGNIVDADFVMNIMQKATAATDATMGIMREGGERRSASEFSGTMQMAVSRLEHLARLVSVQYFQDLAYFHASHTQQLMSQEVFVKAVGDWPSVLMEEFKGQMGARDKVKVSPFDILADFDVIFKDASHSSADAIENDFWTRSFQTIGNSQELMQKFDITRIFEHMARINGAKNVRDFIRLGGDVNAVTASDANVNSQVQKGNIIPFDQFAAMRNQGM